jgi:hypothetical protein
MAVLRMCGGSREDQEGRERVCFGAHGHALARVQVDANIHVLYIHTCTWPNSRSRRYSLLILMVFGLLLVYRYCSIGPAYIARPARAYSLPPLVLPVYVLYAVLDGNLAYWPGGFTVQTFLLYCG